MTLQSGDALGRFRIAEEIGAGGMGVVYRAFDERLGRDVAIKVVSDKVSDNPDLISRFKREARAVAKLGHPNIVALYDFVEEGQTVFAVMEYLEGETLGDRLQRGKLSVEETTEIGIGVVEGLKAAHEKGLVHRDIKPANIFLTAGSHSKVLDFGLAHRQALPSDDTQSHNEVRTEAGAIMGTVGYMSPEQVRGQDVDARSDIFSFGAVLYEMITEERAFKGDTAVETMTAILHDTVPDPSRRDLVLPPPFDQVLQRCLAKERNDRFQNAGELLEALRYTRPGRQHQSWPVIAGAGIVAVLLAMVGFALRPKQPAVPPVSRNASPEKVNSARRAREEILPRILAHADEGEYWEAFQLAKEVEQYLTTDPIFNDVLERVSYEAAYEIEPPGADVYIREYGRPSDSLEYLGVSPIAPIRVVRTPKLLHIEKEGYISQETLAAGRRVRRQLVEVGECPEDMVLVPSDTATWGGFARLASRPTIRTDASFLIDKYEVTNQQFQAFVDAGGYQDRKYWSIPFAKEGREVQWSDAMELLVDQTGRPGPSTWQVGTYPEGRENYPVRGISWYEANAYANFVGKQLPTVAHWCTAANVQQANAVLPVSNVTTGEFAEVGQYPGVSFCGAYDFAGNVAEWCWNSNAGRRFCLGGSALDRPYAFSNPRVADPFERGEGNGFRCVRYLSEEDPSEWQLAEIPFESRDYSREHPVSDDVFEAFKRNFSYDPVDFNETVEYTKDDWRDFTKVKVVITAAYDGERMPIYLYLPKKIQPPYQAIVYFHDASAIMAASSEDNSVARQWDFIMKSGRALVHPVVKGTYERNDGLDAVMANETKRYAEFFIKWVKDVRRTVDYLETRDDIDMDRLGYMGSSWGARLGLAIPAVEQRFSINVCYAGGLCMQRAPPEVDLINYVTRVKIPTLMVNGRFDTIFPYELSSRPAFDRLGTAEKDKKFVPLDSGHAVLFLPRVRETLDWLDKYWGQPGEGRLPPNGQ